MLTAFTLRFGKVNAGLVFEVVAYLPITVLRRKSGALLRLATIHEVNIVPSFIIHNPFHRSDLPP